MSLARDGFAIFRDVFSPQELDDLRARLRGHLNPNEPGKRLLGDFPLRLWDFVRNKNILAILPRPDLEPVRAILFNKTSEANWPVAWHQDRTIAVKDRIDTPGYGSWTVKGGIPHVQPPAELLDEMATLRVHLDPTPAENGALHMISGSHRHGFITQDEIATCAKNGSTIAECEPGDVLIMRPLLLHSSRRAEIPTNRRVLHFELAPKHLLPASLKWSE